MHYTQESKFGDNLKYPIWHMSHIELVIALQVSQFKIEQQLNAARRH